MLDLCAGGGGKTLALAAEMDNRGQIYATDTDGRRLMPIYARLERANVRNVQVRAPRGQCRHSRRFKERCDLVLIDAPCTGTGTWRRNPDAKWRIRPGALAERIKAQDALLARAAAFVKPGGRIAYVTCSVLREENEDRIGAFLQAYPQFALQSARRNNRSADLQNLLPFATNEIGLRLSPATTHTDGFYIAMLTRGRIGMLKPAERRYALPMPTPRRGKRHRQIRRVFLARHLQKTQHAEMFRWQLHIMQREAPLREMPVEHGKTAGARAGAPVNMLSPTKTRPTATP